MLVAQGNLGVTYERLGRYEDALRMKRDVYFRSLKLEMPGDGEDQRKTFAHTLGLAINYADSLRNLQHFEEAKSVLRKAIPVARRVLGETDEITLKMRKVYAGALWQDDATTLDDLRESVTMLEDLERTARRVYGNSHPTTIGITDYLEHSQAVLRARYKSRYWDILACSFAVALFAWVWWYLINE